MVLSARSRPVVKMRGAVSLFLCVAILWQGEASRVPTTPFAVASKNEVAGSEGKGGVNIVLDPGKDSVLATLEFLQNEHNQLKQDTQQSQAQVMAQLQCLQEENSQLKQQQQSSQAMMEHQEALGKQVLQQVSLLLMSVGEMRGQQEMVMEQAGLVQSVLEGVQEFEGWADNVTSHLTHIQDRLVSVEASVLLLQGQGSDHAQQLTAVQQRMDTLESLLHTGGGSEAPSTPSPTTPVPVPSTSDAHVSTDKWTWWVPFVLSPSPPPSTTEAAAGQLQFTVPPDNDLRGGDSLITSILVTSGGKLITGDLYQRRLTMSSLQSPASVEDVYEFEKPWAMLELQDGTIAVTAEYDHKIKIVRITDHGLEHVRTIATTKTYFGITQGPDDTLIVSDRTTDTRASIDIIDMDGNIQRTILRDLQPLDDPYCLKRFGDDVYVSDWSSRRVFRVNIYTGEVNLTVGKLDLSDLEFYQPRKMDIDSNGNVYIATGGGVCDPRSFCIIRVTQAGSWQMMDTYIPQRGGGYPYGLEVTSSQIILSWGIWDQTWSSELTSYALPQLLEESVPALSNVALNKPALQSTYHPLYGNPEKAVDGSTATAISQCTHTADVDSNPTRWWRVDLMGLFEVEAVVITNRGDCCGDRLTHFDIYVMEEAQLDPSESTHDPSGLCLHSDAPISDGATVRLECDRPITGQYVSLVLRTDSWPLNFCEIAVLGRPATATTTPRSRKTTTAPGSSSPSSSKSTTPAPWEGNGSTEGSGDVDGGDDGGDGGEATTPTLFVEGHGSGDVDDAEGDDAAEGDDDAEGDKGDATTPTVLVVNGSGDVDDDAEDDDDNVEGDLTTPTLLVEDGSGDGSGDAEDDEEDEKRETTEADKLEGTATGGHGSTYRGPIFPPWLNYRYRYGDYRGLGPYIPHSRYFKK